MYKPFRTVNEQVQILESRNLIVGDDSSHYLRREGYYDIINGYKDLFLDNKPQSPGQTDHFADTVTFEDIYTLFLFDRNLRFLMFEGLAKAEAVFKTACSYCFMGEHRTETNPYLNVGNYDQSKTGSANKLINAVFNKIRNNNDGNHPKKEKDYIRHCMISHGGEVPLWVLANDLSFGQMKWFFQVLDKHMQIKISEEITNIYRHTRQGQHDIRQHEYNIKTDRLQRILNRLVFFRNICAHDERLFCAKYDNRVNESVFAAINDLRFFLDKDDYIAFYKRFLQLLRGIKHKLPDQWERLHQSMGIRHEDELMTKRKKYEGCQTSSAIITDSKNTRNNP